MATVAEQLRRAREEQMLNVHQVAEITKIKTDHIRALEAGQYDTFSAPVYIRGFVRTYARALKLDSGQLVSALEAELNEVSPSLESAPAAKGAGRMLDLIMLQLSKLNWRIVLATVTAALVIILAATAINNMTRRNTDPLKNLGPGLYAPPTNQSGEILTLPEAN